MATVQAAFHTPLTARRGTSAWTAYSLDVRGGGAEQDKYVPLCLTNTYLG